MKTICIGDLHWGERNNDHKYNQQLLDFIDWVCELAEERGIEHCVQFGDWFHHRSKIDVGTMNYSTEGAKRLNKQFGKDCMWVLLGNHCLYYLNRLDVHSLKTIEHLVTVVDEPTSMDGKDILVVPWITDEAMWDEVVGLGTQYQYLFSHLELNGFMVNDGYAMESGYSHRELRDYKRVITGHYHSPQVKDNVQYLGTPLPITMNEANEEHGIYILDTEDDTVEFVPYDVVKVVSIPYERFHELKDLDPENTYVRVEFPSDLEDETILTDIQNQLKEMNFQQSKIKYESQKTQRLLEADTSHVEEVGNIDAVVLQFIHDSTQIEGIDKDMLGSLYNEAKEHGEAE